MPGCDEEGRAWLRPLGHRSSDGAAAAKRWPAGELPFAAGGADPGAACGTPGPGRLLG